MSFSDIFDLVKTTFQEWTADKASRLGAALAYYTIFAIGPLILLIIAIAGFVWGEKEAQEEVFRNLQSVLGEGGADMVSEMLASASDTGAGVFSTIVGTASLLLAATGIFGQLQDALNTIWGIKMKPGAGIMVMIKERLMTFLMVVGTGLLVLASLIVNTVLATIGPLLEDTIPGGSLLLQVLNYAVSLGLITLVFAIIYKVLPDVTIQWRDVWIGALVTAVLFMLGQFVLAIYLSTSNPGSAYGAAGSLVLLLVWIYYTAQIVFLGAEFTQVYANKYGADIRPSGNAAWVSAEERAKQGLSGEKPHRARADRRDRGEPDEPPRIPRFYGRPEREPLPEPVAVSPAAQSSPVPGRQSAAVVGAALIPVALMWVGRRLFGGGRSDA